MKNVTVKQASDTKNAVNVHIKEPVDTLRMYFERGQEMVYVTVYVNDGELYIVKQDGRKITVL